MWEQGHHSLPAMTKRKATGLDPSDDEAAAEVEHAKRARADEEEEVAAASDALPAAASAAAATAAPMLVDSATDPAPPDLLAEYKRIATRNKDKADATNRLASSLLMDLYWPRSPITRWEAVTEQILEDAARAGGPLLSLSQPIAGKGPLLMLIIKTLAEDIEGHNQLDDEPWDTTRPNESSDDEDEPQEVEDKRRRAVLAAFGPAVPHVCALIRSSYDASLTYNGRNALHLLCKQFIAETSDDWVYQFAAALLDRRCSANTTDAEGCTPLLQWCANGGRDMTACGPLLLLKGGASVNASDERGFTVVHVLAWTGKLRVLRGLAVSGWLAAADLTLRSKAENTPLQVALRKLAEEPDDSDRREIVEILREAIPSSPAMQMAPANCSSHQAGRFNEAASASMQTPAVQSGSSTGLSSAARERCKRATTRAVESARLATLLLNKRRPLVEKWTEAARMLLADAARAGGPVISLSFAVEGKGPLLMQLIVSLRETSRRKSDMEDEAKLKEQANDAFARAVPHVCALIRNSFDVSLTYDGRDALHVLTSSTLPESEHSWSYQLAAALLDRGCDVNARDPDGRTPLLNWCVLDVHETHPCGLLLLLERGADINAPNTEWEFTALHWMSSYGQVRVLRKLEHGGFPVAVDLSLRTMTGETALELAERRLAEHPSNSARREIVDIFRELAAAKEDGEAASKPAPSNSSSNPLKRAAFRSEVSSKLAEQLLSALSRASHAFEKKSASEAVARLLLKDAARPDYPLIDLSQHVEGKGPLLMLLIEKLIEETDMSFHEATPSHFGAAFPYMCFLIRSSYDATLTHGGLNALQVLAKGAAPMS